MSTDLNLHLHTIASDLNIPLDPLMSDVSVDSDGRVLINAMPMNLPTTDEERSLMQSALHVAILDSFQYVTPLTNVQVQIIVPTCQQEQNTNDTPCPTTSWIKVQHETINEFAQTTAHTMVQSVYARVLRSYPWRDMENMYVRAIRLVEIFKANMMLSGAFDPIISNGNVDALLPPIHGLINNYTTKVVLRDVTSYLGRTPASLFEVYECVYRMRKTWCASLETMQLYSLLFHGMD